MIACTACRCSTSVDRPHTDDADPNEAGYDDEDDSYSIFEGFYNEIQGLLEILYLEGKPHLCGLLGKAKGKVLELAPVIHVVEHFLQVRRVVQLAACLVPEQLKPDGRCLL